MAFLITLACAVVLVIALKPAIKKAPIVWYAIAVVLVVLYLAGTQGLLPAAIKGAVFLLLQKGMLAMALFAIVMYIGVLPVDSKPRTYLTPIRSELSIIACILIFGHMAAYAMSYVPRILSGGVIVSFVAVGLGVAAVLTVLWAVLGVTSFGGVKACIAAQTWTRIQRWAYVFYALMYVHVLARLLPSALAGGASATQSVVVYTVVFAVYAVARIARAAVDRKRSVSAAVD